MQLRTIHCNTHVYTFHVCLCLLALTFVCNSTYLLKLEVQMYDSKQHDALIIHVCFAYLFLHSGQVRSSSKCYFKRKYLNLIDSNCDVNESCPAVVFYRDCPCHRPWMYYQYICDIGEEKSLWDGCSSICSRSVAKPARYLVMEMQIFLCL